MNETLTKCTGCGKSLPKTDFYSSKPRRCKGCLKLYRDGHVVEKTNYDIIYRNEHRERINARQRLYCVTHHDEIRIYQRSKAPEYVALNKKWSIMHPVRRWAISSIGSHKTRGYKLNISINEVEKLATNTEFCPICGIKLDYSRHRGLGPGPQPNSPSLDRIENTDTLNIDNVWVICIRCNNHKSDKSMKEFVEYCRHVVEIFGGD